MSVPKKVVLHIGLPKTATTLLQQHVFPELNEKVDYIGVKQPRSLQQDEIYLEIWRLVRAQKSEYEGKLTDLKAKLEYRLANNDRPLILSEEGFCLDAGHTSWQIKISRLAEIFIGHDMQVIVTVRHPISAIFSYYVEVYQSVKSNFPNFIDFVNDSNMAKIYDYDYLDMIISRSFGKGKVNYIPFELLDSERFLPEVLNIINIDTDFDFSLPNTNAKRKSEIGIKTHHRTVFSYCLFVFKVPIISRIIKIEFLKPFIGAVRNRLKNFRMPLSQVEIKTPTKSELIVLNERYSRSISFINNKIDFYYEKSKE